MLICINTIVVGARHDHLIVIVHTHPSARQAAGIVAVDASTAVVDIAVLIAGTLAGDTVAAGTGLRYLENTVAVHRSTIVSVLVVRQHMVAEALRMSPIPAWVPHPVCLKTERKVL